MGWMSFPQSVNPKSAIDNPKMNLREIAAGAMICVSFAVCAKGNITGTVSNKGTGEPMDFVTVQIFDAASGTPLQISASTDENGHFTLKGVPDGNYVVKVINVGSVNQERNVGVKGSDIDLGNIRLADDAKLLKEVVVEGIRSQMRFELDRKVFQVDANIASAGQSASELLESIPSVEVDQDGEVSLRGNSSVTVWINGKDSGLTADNRAQILEQIPGESIEKIEVITNPSAKYSPEGTAGIINIVLKKDRRGGYFGSAEVSANSRGGGNVSANINWNTARWDTYASIGFRMRHNTGGTRMDRVFDDGTFVRSEGTGGITETISSCALVRHIILRTAMISISTDSECSATDGEVPIRISPLRCRDNGSRIFSIRATRGTTAERTASSVIPTAGATPIPLTPM